METDLLDARWNTVVLTDGIPADTESGEGRVKFINGYVLSYPTSRDITLEVTVTGTVPDATSRVTVLSVQELSNLGSPVPGSTVTITEPVLIPPSSPAATPPPATTVPLPSASPSPSPAPTRAGAFPWPAGLAAVLAMGLGRIWPGRRRRP